MDDQKNPIMPVLTGQHWGQYHITGSVEQGRFSRAYLGVHIQHPSKQLVVEIFPMTLTADDGTTFLQSGHSLMQLVHPSILRLFDVGIENATPFIVLDSIQHIPLRQLYLRGQGQPLEKLLPYLRQIASALQYTHAQGRVHKHLRPDSVLLSNKAGQLAPNSPPTDVFLCDFAIDGIDKNELFQSYQRRILPIEPLAYMAPEQMQQQPVNASDQYALGTMIYEWLCGTPPFLGNPSEIAHQQLYSAPSGLRQKEPRISPDVEEVVMMTLVKDPSKRFTNVPAFVNALEHAYSPMKPGDQGRSSRSASVPITPPPQPIIAGPIPIEVMGNPSNAKPSLTPNALPSSVSIASPLAKRQQKSGNDTRRAFLISAASIAVVGGVGSWLLWNRLHPSSPPPPPPPTGTPAPIQSGQPVVYREHTARVNAVTWSPDGQKIASASDDKLVLICDRAGKTLLTYSGHKNQVNAVAWSPNGLFIASGGADQTVQIWDATSGKLAFTYTGHAGAVNAIAWSTDNRFVASGSDDKTVQAWFATPNKATTGNVFLTYGPPTGHKAAVTSVAWSPDGTKIASGSWDNTLQVCSAIQNEAFAVGDQIFSAKIHGENVVYAVAWSPDGTLIASGGGDNLVQICDGITGNTDEVGYKSPNVPRHHNPVRSVAWSPDGKLIVSGGDDKIARVWDATTGKPTLTYSKHSNAVLAVAWSPDSAFVSSGSADTSVQLWKSL
jgi:eukaryotic-like serine/threonine-protein kinase